MENIKIAFAFRQKCWDAQKHFQNTFKLNSSYTTIELKPELNNTENISNNIEFNYKNIDEIEENDVIESDIFEIEEVHISCDEIDINDSVKILKVATKPKKARKKEYEKFKYPSAPKQPIDRPESDKRICEICGKHLASSHSLKYHILQVHTDYRPFPCSLCDFRSHRKSDLEVSL